MLRDVQHDHTLVIAIAVAEQRKYRDDNLITQFQLIYDRLSFPAQWKRRRNSTDFLNQI